MPYSAPPPSSSSRKPAKRHKGSNGNSSNNNTSNTSSRSNSNSGSHKQLNFSTVEVINGSSTEGKGPRAIPPTRRNHTSKLKRSPTPVLHSLTDLTNAHFHQLSSVWRETSLPSFESDKRDIAATRKGTERDPFDF